MKPAPWIKEVAQIDARLRNACRLLEDAALLRRHHRYPSATAMAVLSLEEIGKFWQTSDLNWDAVQSGSAARSHGHKQASAARILMGGLDLGQLEVLIGRFGYRLELQRRGQERSPEQKSLAEFQAVVRASNSVASDDPIVGLMQGKFDRLKQACLYVDQTPEGWSEPNGAVDRQLTDKVIALPRRALRQIYQRHERQKLLRTRGGL